MRLNHLIYILIFFMIMITIILLLILYNKINSDDCIYYYQNGDVGENIDLSTKAVFKKYSIIKTTVQSQALLYIPYSYNYVPQEIEKMRLFRRTLTWKFKYFHVTIRMFRTAQSIAGLTICKMGQF